MTLFYKISSYNIFEIFPKYTVDTHNIIYYQLLTVLNIVL